MPSFSLFGWLWASNRQDKVNFIILRCTESIATNMAEQAYGWPVAQTRAISAHRQAEILFNHYCFTQTVLWCAAITA